MGHRCRSTSSPVHIYIGSIIHGSGLVILGDPLLLSPALGDLEDRRDAAGHGELILFRIVVRLVIGGFAALSLSEKCRNTLLSLLTRSLSLSARWSFHHAASLLWQLSADQEGLV